MPLNFPGSPTNGQTHTEGSTSWIYDSTYGVWNMASGPVGYTGSIGYTGSVGVTSYSTNIGNGSNNWYTITHNLNSTYPLVQIKENNSNNIVYPDITIDTSNTTIITFVDAPSANQYSITLYKVLT